MNILMTVEELAKYLRIKPDTIYKKVRRGELPAIKLGKLVRFPKELIDEWIIEQATRTMREMRAARKVVRARVDEAVQGVRKTAKAAGKAATRVIGEVPEVFEDVRNAPLKKKQATLTKGLRGLWRGFNRGLVGGRRTPRARVKKADRKSSRSKTGNRSRPVRVSAAPASVSRVPASV